jgi:hypothetical protein
MFTTAWIASVIGCCISLLLIVNPAYGWVFPEHVEVTGRALKTLDAKGSPAKRALLSTLQQSLPFCTGDRLQRCPTFASLAALAADHSCTPRALRSMLVEAQASVDHWLWRVLRVANDTQIALDDAARDAAAREDVRRQMHVELQLADPQYLARALFDYGHFQATRGSGSSADLSHYLSLALGAGERANATASYVNYHVVAVRLGAEARTAASAPERNGRLVRALAAEAFALHFLEDSFSSGHFVGHWGDDATRLGTHDYYSRTGLEAVRWSSPTDTFVAHGDAFMSDAEAEVIAAAVRMSLAQVLGAASDAAVAARLLADFHDGFGEEEYDSCARGEVPFGLSALAHSKYIKEVIAFEPVPAPRFPPLARVRAEKGFFAGGAATAAASYSMRPRAGGAAIRATARAGFGAASIVDDPLNAQAFVEIGFVGQYLALEGTGANLIGASFRIRAPGYVCLVDGAVALLLAQSFQAKCPFCLRWGAAAAGGGLGKVWRSHPLFGSVSWQVSALRDVSVNWFHDEPHDGSSRWELLFSAVTARSVLPIAGERLSQSTDFYLDVGPSVTFATGQRLGYGLFASLAMATRVFP